MKRFEYDFNREFAPLADRLSRVQGLNGLGDRLIAPFETWSPTVAQRNPLPFADWMPTQATRIKTC